MDNILLHFVSVTLTALLINLIVIMKVFINHQAAECGTATTLAELLRVLELERPGVAVAVDNKVIRRDMWGDTPLYADMKITVIQAVCGG